MQLLNVPEDGVPKTGVTSVGLVANTSAPVPVSSVTAAAKLADDGVPSQVATPDPSEVRPVPPYASPSALVGVRVVAVNAPVLGLNCSLVDETSRPVSVPVVASVKVT